MLLQCFLCCIYNKVVCDQQYIMLGEKVVELYIKLKKAELSIKVPQWRIFSF